jgi:pyrroloquinoline quinone biosynthesis protein B
VALGALACGDRASVSRDDAHAGALPDPAGGLARGPYVQVLGTAQDGGLPHAACDCTRCAAARSDPQRRRRIASLAICLPASGKVYLVDATPDVREQLHQLRGLRDAPVGGVDRAPVDGVFLTHAHLGHYLGLAFFGFEAVHTRSLPVYSTAAMGAFLDANAPWDQLVRLGNIQRIQIEPDSPVELEDGVTVTALLVPHRDEYSDTVAYLIAGPDRSVLYVPDTDAWASWSPPLRERLEDVDVALLDGTFFSLDELPGRAIGEIGHPLIETTMDLLESRVAGGALEVLFTHLNHSNPALDPGGAARRTIHERGFAVAGDGQVFALYGRENSDNVE